MTEDIPLRDIPLVKVSPAEVSRDLMAVAMKVRQEAGPVGMVSVFGAKMVFVTDPHMGHQILVEEPNEFYVSGAARRIWRFLGRQAIVSLNVQDPLHMQMRRDADMGVGIKVVPGYEQIVRSITREEFDAAIASGQPVDLVVLLRRVTLRVIFDALIKDHSLSVETQLDFANRLGEIAPFLQKLATFGQLAHVISPLGSLNYSRIIKQKDDLLWGLVEQRMSLPDGGESYDDFLQYLIRKYRNDPDVRMILLSQFTVLFLAGHETSAIATAAGVWHIANDEHYQTELTAEVMALGNKKGDKNTLPFAWMFGDETMRRYTPAPFNVRTTGDQGFTLILKEPQGGELVSVGRYFVPGKATLVFNQYGLHHDPAYYAEPYAFNPYRFRPDVRPSRLVHVPLGGGPRVCSGGAFATHELAWIFTEISPRYKFKPVNPHQTIKLKFNSTLLHSIAEPLWVVVSRA